MPACFTLTRVGESKPSSFQRIDAELCRHMGVPVDPANYLDDWRMFIGLALSVCASPDKITEYCADGESLPQIWDYIRMHYESDAWRE